MHSSRTVWIYEREKQPQWMRVSYCRDNWVEVDAIAKNAKKAHKCFVDLVKAYDTVARSSYSMHGRC